LFFIETLTLLILLILNDANETFTVKYLIIPFLLTGLALQAMHVAAFDIENFEGEKVNFDALLNQNKWSLIMFWSHDCGVCRVEIPELSRFHIQQKNNDIQVIGISIDGLELREAAKIFLKETKPSFESYLGDIRTIAPNYELGTQEAFRGTPTFLLFSPKGELMANNAGKVSIKSLKAFIARNTLQKT